mmetsp:Transcript_46975/g.34389  ORF Transcript_46975/g.34389 Transcript_46975/m.34389 type:complete len:212 (+) Transcript_46975:923-1558(+)
MILRSYRDQEFFEYEKLGEVLYEVRFELIRSRLMETNLPQMADHLIYSFAHFDEGNGLITINEARAVLLSSKKTNLTPFQANVLIGYSNCDEYGRLNYKEFAVRCQELIGRMFCVKALQEKAYLIAHNVFQPDEKLSKVGVTKLDLFKQFKKFDRNNNGFLEIEEYIECLTKGEARLEMTEIVTLALTADINGDRRIDYEELMLHFHEIMR